MNLSCLWEPGPCLTTFADTILSLFPFGLHGLVFLAGMIVGERIGIIGIIAAVLIWLGARFATKAPADPIEQLPPDSPDAFEPRRKAKVPVAKRTALTWFERMTGKK